eukprot:4943610-Amphidinium_carterae.1
MGPQQTQSCDPPYWHVNLFMTRAAPQTRSAIPLRASPPACMCVIIHPCKPGRKTSPMLTHHS